MKYILPILLIAFCLKGNAQFKIEHNKPKFSNVAITKASGNLSAGFTIFDENSGIIERVDSFSNGFAKRNNLIQGCKYIFVFDASQRELMRMNLSDSSMIISDTAALIKQLIKKIFNSEISWSKRYSKQYDELGKAKDILKEMFVRRYCENETIITW
jgi:hypothetical protein